MKIRLLILFLAFYFLSGSIIYSQVISVDEDFSDWEGISVLYSDDTGDFSTGDIDFGELKIFNDSKYIYFFIELGTEVNLQNNNDVKIYIDTDNNSSTGVLVNDIGVDFEYSFGERSGKIYFLGGSSYIGAYNVGLVSSPTVTSEKFEFLFERTAVINWHTVFPSETIKVVFKSNTSGGDILPNETGGVEYSFDPNVYVFREYSINLTDENSIRFMSYNVLTDNLFDADKKENCRRIFQALKPDVIGFQEIYNHSGQETANLISEFLPEDNWYYKKKNNDIIYVGKFPVLQSWKIDGNTAFLLDLTAGIGKEMLFICAHPPCCLNDEQRQQEIDNFMSFVREAKLPGGDLMLEENSPIVIVGDMNLVGLRQQQTTLLTGDIFDEATYGEDFSPDWDGTALEDAKPNTTGHPSSFTWYRESSSYSAGRLDYIVYTGSVLEKKNSFTLFIPAMSLDSLTAHGLQSNDVTKASDHIPLIADLVYKGLNSVEDVSLKPEEFYLEQNYPNPFNPTTRINYYLTERANAEIKVFNILGEIVEVLVNKAQQAGSHMALFNANNLPSGIYYYRMRANEFFDTKKLLLLK